MQVGKYKVSYERTWRTLCKGRLCIVSLRVDDPSGRINYMSINHGAGSSYKFRVGYGHKPSLTHHATLGNFDSPMAAINAIVCELRMRSYEKGTREHAEAYRDRWLPGVAILDALPEGWHIKDDALTNPSGTRWASNGESLFGGKYEHALVYVG